MGKTKRGKKGKFKKVIAALCFALVMNGGISLYAYATPPSRLARFLFSLEEAVHTETEAISLFQRNKERIIKILNDHYPNYCVKEAKDQHPRSTCQKKDSSEIDFLFTHLSSEVNPEFSRIHLIGGQTLFQVRIPIVLKGSDYKVKDGKIILKEYPPSKQEELIEHIEGNTKHGFGRSVTSEGGVVYASSILLFVDEEGNVYD